VSCRRRESAECESSIPLLPGPGLTAPNEWELLQVEQLKETTFTKQIDYPVFHQTAFSEKGQKEEDLNSKYLHPGISDEFCKLHPSVK